MRGRRRRCTSARKNQSRLRRQLRLALPLLPRCARRSLSRTACTRPTRLVHRPSSSTIDQSCRRPGHRRRRRAADRGRRRQISCTRTSPPCLGPIAQRPRLHALDPARRPLRRHSRRRTGRTRCRRRSRRRSTARLHRRTSVTDSGDRPMPARSSSRRGCGSAARAKGAREIRMGRTRRISARRSGRAADCRSL